MIFNFLFALALFNFITPVSDKTTELNNNTCSVCRDTVWVIEEMESLPNVTINAIVKVIERVCGVIHTPQGKECEIIIKDIDTIIKNITAGLSPDKICHYMGLCNVKNKIDFPEPPGVIT